MIRHLTIVDLDDQCTDELRTELVEMIAGLPQHIPELLSMSVNATVSPTGETENRFALVADFANNQDLQAYLSHPQHVAVGRAVASAKKSAIAADIVID